MADKSTLSDYLAELGVDINNMQEFLNKLSLMLTTPSDTVNINQTLQDGTVKTFNVPSFAHLSDKINSIDTKFNSLLSANGNQIGVKDANGTLKTFELQDVSKVISDLDSVSNAAIEIPETFKYKTNWFFESFLNPLIYIDLPIQSIVTADVDRFEVLRVLMTSQLETNTTYFDQTYSGKNNIAYSELIKDLSSRGIPYFEDTNEVSLPPSQNKKTGVFNISGINRDVPSTDIVAGVAVSTTVTKYKLDTLKYDEKLASSPNGLVQRTLKIGDRLLTADNSEYEVKGVETAGSVVILNRIFGIGTLAQGTELRIKPEIAAATTLPINIGYNDRQVIFLKPISSRLKLSTESYSKGVGVFSNTLTIGLNNGKTMTMSDFYKQFVSDFGLMFVNYAKEKKLPSALGQIPNLVTLDTASFKVVRTDAHIQADNDIADVKQNISSIESLKAQIREVDKQISSKRSELNTNAQLTESIKLKLNKDLSTLTDERNTLTTQYSSYVSSVTTSVNSTPQLISPPVYKVKGFWAIPAGKDTAYGLQQIVQFKVQYRILSKTGASEEATQISVTDSAGNQTQGSISPWKEFLTKPRVKKLDPLTGFYVWQEESISDPTVVNSNQLELPINKGEVLEIKVKSLSEAGWPENPTESDWSNSVLVEFPANLQSIEDISVISQQVFAEEARINFQDELNAKGLDIHLSTAFTSRDKYFAHRAEDVASGFFSSDGSIVDLYTKLKSITDSLAAIQTSIATGAGQLKVSLVDQSGGQISVKNGQTVEIFAGYYKDQIKNSAGATVTYDHGKIITAQYYIQLENASQTPLQLISSLLGGLGEKAPVSNPANSPSDAYHTSLRYDAAPISISNVTAGDISAIRQISGYQSSQVKGQIIYRRGKSVNLATKLVEGDRQLITTADPDNISYDTTLSSSNYGYQGVNIGGQTVPYAAGHYLPYDPTLSNLTVLLGSYSPNSNVWNGLLDTNSSPIGGGLLSEFCISIDHPDIKAGGKYNSTWSNLYRPVYSSSSATKQITLPFSQAIHSETAVSDNTNAFGASYEQQAAYSTPITPSPLVLTSAGMREENYPIKLGYTENDRYLIGKYTCGAYLYIAPKSYEDIGATSFSPTAAKRLIEFGTTSAIQIPLIFQYRCSDYLKYVGGYRGNATSGLVNVKYAKKIGLDISLKEETFSFDVLVSAEYDKETTKTVPTSFTTITNTTAGAPTTNTI